MLPQIVECLHGLGPFLDKTKRMFFFPSIFQQDKENVFLSRPSKLNLYVSAAAKPLDCADFQIQVKGEERPCQIIYVLNHIQICHIHNQSSFHLSWWAKTQSRIFQPEKILYLYRQSYHWYKVVEIDYSLSHDDDKNVDLDLFHEIRLSK